MAVDPSKIRFVDGFKIRNTLDDDFAIIHESSSEACYYAPKFYIPKGEIWFDHRFQDELDFLLRLEEVKDELTQTLSYHEARKKFKEMLCLTTAPPPIETERKPYEDGLTVVMVDGKVLRQYLDPEFIFGGHHLVYSYIPEKEIWLDTHMDPAEVPYILLHEKVEFDLMTKGKSYDVAHEFATAADKELRRADGVGAYPGEEAFTWFGKTNKELAHAFYVTD